MPSFVFGAEVACLVLCRNSADILVIDTLVIEDPIVSATLSRENTLHSIARRSLSVRLFYVPSRAASCKFPHLSVSIAAKANFAPASVLCRTFFGVHRDPPGALVPCRFIASTSADDWDYAICIHNP